MSGGTKRTTLAPAGTRRSPRAAAAAHTSAAVAFTASPSSRPRRRPQPRISLTAPSPALAATSPRRAASCAPRTSALATRPARSSSFKTAIPAAHARKFPPKVVAWSPGWKTAAASVQVIAPMGTPPPRALAELITSGVTPRCSWPQKRPVRPTPVCTSSTISSAPRSSQMRRASAKKARSPGVMPPSPWRGSSRMAARRSSLRSPRGPRLSARAMVSRRAATSL
mmetsp:Transcript_2953/g.9709  ORF Transcript_2953/g.9709 Transcript_2953/m.9709 type:complete len:225 (-) Transcript_2953:613-1287(-)